MGIKTKWISKTVLQLLFSTAIVIIALHNLIPHLHSSKLSKEEHFQLHHQSNSVIGLIRLALHESGEDNLVNLIYTQNEGLKKIDFKHKNPIYGLINYTSLPKGLVLRAKTIKWNTDNFNNLLFVRLNGLRGPPFLS